jgi:NlpC/P60 family putative phage cell wall peptidase
MGALLARAPAITRDAILAEARDWLGTPWRHRASEKHAGVDCLGLLRGVWRAVIGPEPEALPDYSPAWDEPGRELLLLALGRHFVNVARADARPGDLLVFRMAPGAPAKHVAVLEHGGRIIHAYWARAAVESRLAPWWRDRLAAAFSFPGVSA